MSYDVNIERLEPDALIELQGSRERVQEWLADSFPDMPATPNTAMTQQHLSLYWIAPEKWLLRAPLGREDEVQALTRIASAPIDISVVLVSDTLKFFSVMGPNAGQIVSVACPLDIHPAVFPDNGVTYTEVFGLKALLLRGADGYEIAVESSFADMVADYFSRVCAS